MTVAVILKVWNEEALISLCLNQFNDTGIDTLYLFDDGSTDKTVDIALSLPLSYQLRVITVSEPHEEYFPDQPKEPEARLLNRMIDTAVMHDWIIHVDADEILTPQAVRFISTLHSLPLSIAGCYIPYYHLVGDINRHIIQMPGIPYQLYPDYHMRIFRSGAYRFPDVPGLDAIIQPIHPGRAVYLTGGEGILHTHYLDPNRRGLRGGTASTEDYQKQNRFRQPGCTYGTVKPSLIPECLKEWADIRQFCW